MVVYHSPVCIFALVCLVSRVYAVQDCSRGWPEARATGNNKRVKESFEPCETAPVASSSDTYCTAAFGRAQVSKREKMPTLHEASKLISSGGPAPPKKYIHKCGRIIISYLNDQGLTKSYQPSQNMAVGISCEDIAEKKEAWLKEQKSKKKVKKKINPDEYVCFIDAASVTGKMCPGGRTEITPFSNLYYNAGSTENVIQFEMRACQCTAYHENECRVGGGGATGNAHQSYYGLIHDEEEDDDDKYARSYNSQSYVYAQPGQLQSQAGVMPVMPMQVAPAVGYYGYNAVGGANNVDGFYLVVLMFLFVIVCGLCVAVVGVIGYFCGKHQRKSVGKEHVHVMEV